MSVPISSSTVKGFSMKRVQPRTLRFISELGEGTTFTISLPGCGDVVVADDAESQASGEESTSEGGRILVIEDDPGIRELCEVALAGNHVVTAPDGDVGLKLYAEGEFDAVLLDMSLPGKNGTQVAATIRESDQDIPIVLMSGWMQTSEIEVDMFHRIIEKPFLIEELVEVMEDALGGAKD